MAYSNPNIPTIDITGVDPITGYVTNGLCAGTPANTAGYFAKGCVIQDTTNGLIYQNAGTVASPSFTVNGTGASGASGASGQSGASTSGVSGATGASGQSGYSGASGASGI